MNDPAQIVRGNVQAMWLHMPEISVNLHQIEYVTPGPDGQIVLHYGVHSLTVDGDKAKLVMQALGKQ